jgi:hypothetical protein
MSGEDAPRPYLENLIVPEIKTNKTAWVHLWYCGVVVSELAPRPYLENLIVPEIKTNKQRNSSGCCRSLALVVATICSLTDTPLINTGVGSD